MLYEEAPAWRITQGTGEGIMCREEKMADGVLDKFLEKLKEDSAEYRNLETGGYSPEEKKTVLRFLMNIRMPGGLSLELTDLQDRYLQEELRAKGVVRPEDIPTIREAFCGKPSCGEFPYGDKLSLWQGDITRLGTDAIVNAANSQLLGCFVPCHGCIDNAIHSGAGMQLREECSRIMGRRRRKYGRDYEEPAGTATLTPGYNLPCKYVIHTVGPIVYGSLGESHCMELQSCYENVLKCCLEHSIKTVAFCCISTGEFHFPNDRAAEIAWNTVTAFLDRHGNFVDRIIFNVFKDKDRRIYEKLAGCGEG